MTPERWAKIEDLLHRAVECTPEERIVLLAKSCSDDPELVQQVEALLSSDGSAADSLRATLHVELAEFGFPLKGKVVSHYRVLDGLGRGGMGQVYRAEDTRLGRLVALKFLPEESANNPVALARFEREARSVSAVEHPHICPIYEFGEHEGHPFLVMQLLDGQTLRDLLGKKSDQQSNSSKAAPDGGRLRIEEVIDFAIQILGGLEAAHQKGIIHRDIKPANIFLTNSGQAKILDFGLAKLAHEVAPPGYCFDDDSAQVAYGSHTDVKPFFSRTGTAMGTVGYMSPEQVRGENLDARTDLFSFGLVLYEMATARRAFEGEAEPDLAKAVLTQTPPPVRQLNP